MERKPLTSVHEALSNAVFEDMPDQDAVIALRINKLLKEDVASICHRHGTTLSNFIRQCCIGLANDYRDSSRG